MVRLMAALSLSTIASACPAAHQPSQIVASNPARGPSAMVGRRVAPWTACCGGAQRAHLAGGLNVGRHGGDGVEHHLDMAADDGIAAVACGLVRHMDEVGAGHFLEQLGAM